MGPNGTRPSAATAWPQTKHDFLQVSWAVNHGGRIMHICASKLPFTGPDNGLSPSRRQTIIWTNAGILLIRPSATNFCEISIKIKKSFIHDNALLSAKWRLFCVGLNVWMISITFPLISWYYSNGQQDLSSRVIQGVKFNMVVVHVSSIYHGEWNRVLAVHPQSYASGLLIYTWGQSCHNLWCINA